MEGIKQFWSTGIGKVITIGILGSALPVCALLGITLFRDDTPASPAESQPELSATQTQPVATDTPVQATETAIPTETILPDAATPTDSPVPTDAVPAAGNSYLDEVNVNLQAYQNALANASNYIQTPTTDFNVLLDADWKQNAGMALNQLDEAAKQLESLENPPPEQEQLDMYLKSIASETHELVNNYGNGMDQLDLGAINRAVNNLGNITSYVNSASAELDKYYSP